MAGQEAAAPKHLHYSFTVKDCCFFCMPVRKKQVLFSCRKYGHRKYGARVICTIRRKRKMSNEVLCLLPRREKVNLVIQFTIGQEHQKNDCTSNVKAFFNRMRRFKNIHQ